VGCDLISTKGRWHLHTKRCGYKSTTHNDHASRCHLETRATGGPVIWITVSAVAAMVITMVLLTTRDVASVNNHVAWLNSGRDAIKPITMGNPRVNGVCSKMIEVTRTTRKLAQSVSHPMTIGWKYTMLIL
jgi:hypothetical protein